jgi:hypothetical protein
MKNEMEKFRAILYYLWNARSELKIYVGTQWRNQDFNLLLFNINRFWKEHYPKLTKFISTEIPKIKDMLLFITTFFVMIMDHVTTWKNIDNFIYMGIPLVGAPIIFSFILYQFCNYIIYVLKELPTNISLLKALSQQTFLSLKEIMLSFRY